MNDPQHFVGRKTHLVGLSRRSAPVRQRLSAPINLYDWVTRSFVTASARTTRKHERTSRILSLSWLTQHDASRSPFTYLLSPPPSASGCFRPDIEMFMFYTPVLSIPMSLYPAVSPRSACLSVHGPCVCFHTAERGGARGPWRRRASGSWECHLFF